ncbi:MULTISPECIES: fimbrial biogenesis chaperone [Providencia]|uniref:Molecular chaperone n=1 Tax=Providencia manganoxydans TaxID=2923283 RepID=A0ABX7AHJ7_9GAMM|nr:molecular chaperone [Providencia manganoxydans]MDX4945552.1 molecular chaperone [Providencia manganoxydans]QQO63195.1 molecular chaperone [Providencia manganoxydans]
MRIFIFFILTILSFISHAAGLSLNKTRIIFEEGETSSSVIFKNNVDSPFLVQNEIYNDKNEITDNFLATPNVFRVEGNSTFMMRIFPVSLNRLPTDRESVFYFSARAIPPKKNEKKGSLTIVTNLIIKLYYRPKNLEMLVSDSYNKLIISCANKEIKMTNPTPYYLTVVDFKSKNEKFKNTMIPPYSSETLKGQEKIENLSWRLMNDFGGKTNAYIHECGGNQ